MVFCHSSGKTKTSTLMSVVTVHVFIPVLKGVGPLYPYPHLLVFVFANDVHSDCGEKKKQLKVLISIFLVAKDVEHLFKYLLTVRISSFQNYLFSSLSIY